MRLYPLLWHRRPRLWATPLGVAIALGVSSQPFSCSPRMVDTPSIKPFERKMPEMPKNLVPFSGPACQAPARLPATRQAATRVPNPVKPTPEAVNLGRIYYGYYCIHCHGAEGKGNGTVGGSYVPEPTVLTSPKVQAMSDGALCWSMVMGLGHEPVLDSTVPLERRWYIVHYLRAVARPSRS